MTNTIETSQPLTAATVAQFVEHFTRDQNDEATWTVGDLRAALATELARALDPIGSARKELEIDNVPKHTIDALYPTALQQMVKQVDERLPGHGGYVTYRDEIISILSELSTRVPASVLLEGHRQGRAYKEEDGLISLEITLGFSLERELL